jgi:hypothetical protein
MMSFIKSRKPFGRMITGIYISCLISFCVCVCVYLHFIYINVCVVEFQKRGFPHTNFLVWLAPEFKCHSADVDSIVSAKILDKNQDPICYDRVLRFMMHGPSGGANPKAQCMEKNKCFKWFWKK